MIIKIEGNSSDEVKATAKRIIRADHSLSPAYDTGIERRGPLTVYTATIHSISALEIQTRDKGK